MFQVPESFRGSGFFAVLDAEKPESTPVRNFYVFRCMGNGNARALRDQLAETHAQLTALVVEQDESSVTLRIANTEKMPAAMISVSIPSGFCFAADDGGFWLDLEETKEMKIRFPYKNNLPETLAVGSWNSRKTTEIKIRKNDISFDFSSTGG